MTTLPPATRLQLGSDVWIYDRGRVLVGGAPTRVLRLSRAAARLMTHHTITASDAASARVAERLLDAGMVHPDPDRLPAVDPGLLTVVVPVHGRARQLSRLLAGLRDMRVLVVDDATPEPMASELRATVEAAGARLLRRARNGGPASARNDGLRHVDTPFVAFVDSDVVVDAHALLRLLRHFADPGLALVGPRIVGAGSGSTWIERYENSRSSVDLGARPALVRPRSPVAWISSTCLVARVTALEGGFTEGMRVAEDVDLVWRLAEAGRRVRYEPRVSVAHEHRSDARRWFARKFFYGTGAAVLADRHPGAISPAILRPWSAGVVAALCAGRWWSLPVAGAICAVVARRLAKRLQTGRESHTLPARLVAGGVLSAVTQASALALRHWWPIGFAAALISRRARRVIAVAAATDAVIEHVRLRAELDLPRFALARRLDDIAYGAGVWWGCLRRGRFRALRVELRPERS